MSKFLQLIEQLDPTKNTDPVFDLKDFLNSKGIFTTWVRGTNTLYIDIGGEDLIVVDVKVPDEAEEATEEDAESIQGGYGDYKVNDEVEKLGAKAATGLKGQALKLFGNAAQQAKTAVNQRSAVAKQAVGVYKKDTDSLKKSLQNYNRTSSQTVQQ